MGIVHSQGPAFQPAESRRTWGIIASNFLQRKICITRKQAQLGKPKPKLHKQGLQLLPPLALSSGALNKNFISCRKLTSPRAFPYSFSTTETVSCIHLKATPKLKQINSVRTELSKIKPVRKTNERHFLIWKGKPWCYLHHAHKKTHTWKQRVTG